MCRRTSLPSLGRLDGVVGLGELGGLDDDLCRVDLPDQLVGVVQDLDLVEVGAGLGDLELREGPLHAGGAAQARRRGRPTQAVLDDDVLPHQLVEAAIVVDAEEVAARRSASDGVAEARARPAANLDWGAGQGAGLEGLAWLGWRPRAEDVDADEWTV